MIRSKDCRALDVDAIGRGDTEIAGDIFQAVTGHVAYNEVVAAHGIQCIDQFASCDTVANTAARFRPDGQRLLAAL